MNKVVLLLFLLSTPALSQTDRHLWFENARLGIQFPASPGNDWKPWIELFQKAGARYAIASTSIIPAAVPVIASAPLPIGLLVKLPQNLTGETLLTRATQLLEINSHSALLLLDGTREQSASLAKLWTGRLTGPLTGDRYWNRHLPATGDFLSLDRFLPSAPLSDSRGNRLLWETHYPASDFPKERPELLIRLLAEVAGKGGNLVLDLNEPSTANNALQALGTWLQVNGESIYGTVPGPFDRMPFYGGATQKGDSLYLLVFRWPKNGKLRLLGLETDVLSAELLDGGAKLAILKEGNQTTLHSNTKIQEAADTVVKLKLASPSRWIPYLLSEDSNGVFEATVAACEFEARPGQLIRKDLEGDHVVLTNWQRAIDVPSWKVQLKTRGRYAVSMVYRAAAQSAGATYTITMKGESVGIIKGIVAASSEFKTFPVGEMELDAGNFLLVIQPENKPGINAMTFEKLIFRRLDN